MSGRRLLAANDREHPEIVGFVEQGNFDRLTEAGKRIAARKPRTLREATELLSCVYLDRDTDDAWGLCWTEQLTVLSNVKAFLEAQISPIEEVAA